MRELKAFNIELLKQITGGIPDYSEKYDVEIVTNDLVKSIQIFFDDLIKDLSNIVCCVSKTNDSIMLTGLKWPFILKYKILSIQEVKKCTISK